MFTAVRNEAPFLLEWIAYHQVIGFERFIVFSNPSNDGTDEILGALADAGIIECYEHTPPVGTGAQPNAARIANERKLLNHNDWIIWLDLDEFLVVNAGNGHLTDLLEAIEGKQGLLIPWRLFGDSGNDRFGGRFVSNDFTYATHPWGPKNRHIKMLFKCQPGMDQLGFGGIHRPRISAPGSFSEADFVMANGNCIDGTDKRHREWLQGRDSGSNAWIDPRELGVKLAQINHYSVRTPEHFLLKRLRGDGYFSSESNSERAKRSAGLYKKFNTNIAKDTRILKFEDEVTQAIERLMSVPEVAWAHEMALKAVQSRIAEIPQEDFEELNKVRSFGGPRTTSAAVVRDSTAQSTGSRQPIKLFWWKKKKNFGDQISVDVLAHVAGRDVIWAGPEEAEIFAIGSIMEMARRGGLRKREVGPLIWGTGVMGPIETDFVESVRFCCLRGPITEQFVGKNVGFYGDPGLLIKDALGEEIRKTDEIGIVPHFSNYAEVLRRRSRFPSETKVINVSNTDHLDVIRQIAQCRLILSSSLHGLIVADAFGIPNVWIDHPRKIHRFPRLKFYDYPTAIGRDIGFPRRLSEFDDILKAETDIGMPYLAGIERAKRHLYESFPDELRSSKSEVVD